MLPRPPRSPRLYTLFPYTPLFLSLAVMVGEAFRTHSLFGTVGGLRETGEATNRVLARSALRRAPAIGFIVHTALGIAHRHVPVLLEVRHRAFGRIDRD